MAEKRSREAIAANYQVAREASDSGWHLNPADLRQAVDAKLALTRHRRWWPGLWQLNLEAIERTWDETMGSWVDPSVLPPYMKTIEDIALRLREMRLD